MDDKAVYFDEIHKVNLTYEEIKKGVISKLSKE
jgi:hypothetical protein